MENRRQGVRCSFESVNEHQASRLYARYRGVGQIAIPRTDVDTILETEIFTRISVLSVPEFATDVRRIIEGYALQTVKPDQREVARKCIETPLKTGWRTETVLVEKSIADAGDGIVGVAAEQCSQTGLVGIGIVCRRQRARVRDLAIVVDQISGTGKPRKSEAEVLYQRVGSG